MNLQHLIKKDLMAYCPECRRQSLMLITTKTKYKNEDMLACARCKMVISVQDFKSSLYVV